MKILVGSNNPTKVQAVKNVFAKAEVGNMEVFSRVSAQPFSDDETMEGAWNRARECADAATSTVGIGLEGGVMELSGKLFLCNWGVLVDENKDAFFASGARIPLPEEVTARLEKGAELGEVMDDYAEREGVRKKEGAIGIFTNEEVDREQMFTHVLKLLKGQYSFQTKQR